MNYAMPMWVEDRHFGYLHSIVGNWAPPPQTEAAPNGDDHDNVQVEEEEAEEDETCPLKLLQNQLSLNHTKPTRDRRNGQNGAGPEGRGVQAKTIT